MRDNLSTQGRLLAILPSFDTCIALAQYWEETYRSRAKTEMYVAKSVAAFKASKKMNEAKLSFADDGVHVQCFHTPKSIETRVPRLRLENSRRHEKSAVPVGICKRL
jgi:hypothetical protein